MFRIPKLFSAVALVLVTGVALAAAPKVGTKAPPFTLTDLDGNKHNLTDFAGKYVVLEWFNAECPFVQKHYKSNNMQKLQDTYTGKGVVWLSINSSKAGKEGAFPTTEAGKKVLTDWKAKPTAMLVDADGKVGRAYGAKTTPHMYVLDKTGVVLYMGAIDDKATADVADVTGAKNYVAAALEEAMSGKKVAKANTDPYGCSVKY